MDKKSSFNKKECLDKLLNKDSNSTTNNSANSSCNQSPYISGKSFNDSCTNIKKNYYLELWKEISKNFPE